MTIYFIKYCDIRDITSAQPNNPVGNKVEFFYSRKPGYDRILELQQLMEHSDDIFFHEEPALHVLSYTHVFSLMEELNKINKIP